MPAPKIWADTEEFVSRFKENSRGHLSVLFKNCSLSKQIFNQTSFSHNMWFRNILSILLLIGVMSALQHDIEMSPSFRRLGLLATGLSYGHLHGTIDLRQLHQAHRSVLHVIEERLRTASSKEEINLIGTLKPQLLSGTRILDDLEEMFFGGPHTRHKRQLFIGLAMALGIVSSGTSIYNTVEISKLHSDITSLRQGLHHVAHVMTAEAHAINRLNDNLHKVKESCTFILERLQNQQNEINALTEVIGLLTLIQNFNTELSAWGRGMESLAEGHLHPSLVDKQKLHQAISAIEEQARKSGRRLLHENKSQIYRAPTSFLATEDEKIIFITHVPLVEQQPLEMFELLPSMKRIHNIVMEVSAEKQILATDSRGQTGIEMTQLDLLRCQREDRHNGRFFICPDANVFRNEIRKTCLGGMFFSHQNEIEERCLHTIRLEDKEDLVQIEKDEILLFSQENTTLIEKCSNGTHYHQVAAGITRKKTRFGCELTTKEFTFKSPKDIDEDKNFIVRRFQAQKFLFVNNQTANSIHKAITALKALNNPDKIRVEQIQAWIEQDSATTRNWGINLSISSIVGFIGILLIAFIIIMYIKFRKNNKN